MSAMQSCTHRHVPAVLSRRPPLPAGQGISRVLPRSCHAGPCPSARKAENDHKSPGGYSDDITGHLSRLSFNVQASYVSAPRGLVSAPRGLRRSGLGRSGLVGALALWALWPCGLSGLVGALASGRSGLGRSGLWALWPCGRSGLWALWPRALWPCGVATVGVPLFRNQS